MTQKVIHKRYPKSGPQTVVKIDSQTLPKYDPQSLLKIDQKLLLKIDPQTFFENWSTNITQKVIHETLSQVTQKHYLNSTHKR